MSIHEEPHPQAGQEVTVQLRVSPEAQAMLPMTATITDYWDRIYGKSWMFSEGIPMALDYALRSGNNGLPIDDDVVSVKINGRDELVHVTELVLA